MGANGDSEANLNLNPTLGEWNQYHIPLADFTNAGLTGLDDLNQYIFTSTPFGSGILFLDNVYFTTEIVDVDDLANSKHKVILYPNPVSADANLYLTSEVTTVEIFNLSGQRVLTTNQSAINLQGLETGIYLVKVTDPDGVVHTNKLMVK